MFRAECLTSHSASPLTLFLNSIYLLHISSILFFVCLDCSGDSQNHKNKNVGGERRSPDLSSYQCRVILQTKFFSDTNFKHVKMELPPLTFWDYLLTISWYWFLLLFKHLVKMILFVLKILLYFLYSDITMKIVPQLLSKHSIKHDSLKKFCHPWGILHFNMLEKGQCNNYKRVWI